jgi:hypothetical protein
LAYQLLLFVQVQMAVALSPPEVNKIKIAKEIAVTEVMLGLNWQVGTRKRWL